MACSSAALWKAMLSSAARAMCATVLPRDRPTMAPRASGFQYGAPRPVKAGTTITPPASGTLSASACTSPLALDGVQAVAQPLHHRAADEHAALERELGCARWSAPRWW